MGIKDKKIQYFWGSLKNLIFRGVSLKKQYIKFKRGLGKNVGVVFMGVWYPIVHYVKLTISVEQYSEEKKNKKKLELDSLELDFFIKFNVQQKPLKLTSRGMLMWHWRVVNLIQNGCRIGYIGCKIVFPYCIHHIWLSRDGKRVLSIKVWLDQNFIERF